ncbi:MAG: IMP dehydrogenase, partial [Treponema sp.]|nr:IMP dehydrogenase [Treponema sp.]
MFTEGLSFDDVLLIPGYSDTLPGDCDIRTTLCAGIRLNVPVISAAMDTVTEERLATAIALEGGAGVIHRNLEPEEQARQVEGVKKQREIHPGSAIDKSGRLVVGAAVSPQDYALRLPLLISAGVDFIVLDTAHGDSKSVMEAVKAVKSGYGIPVIGGNVATKEGTRRLIEAGADAVKVGIGPGSICTTRIVAGIGVPQFTAVLDCAEEAAKSGIPVIADGGIKFSGDITKAIGAGAGVVMIGGLFAGLKEAPGREIIFDGRIFKEYRGMGSMGAIADGAGDRYQIGKDEEPVPEGIEGRVPYKGE